MQDATIFTGAVVRPHGVSERATPAVARYAVAWQPHAEFVDAALWSACFRPPAEGLWYYRAFEAGARAAHGSELRFAYGVITQDGRDVGIVPVFSVEVPLALGARPGWARVLRGLERAAPRVLRPRMLFVGSPTTVYGVVGLREGIALGHVLPAVDAALDALAVRERAAVIVWKDPDAGTRAALDARAARGGYCSVPSHAGTVLALAPTWEAYLAALCGRRRYRLKKKLRAAGPALRAEIVEAPDAALRAELFALYRQTHERAAERFEELTPEFFGRIAAAPAAHFVVLRDERRGNAVAFMLCFVIGRRAVNRFVGLDYAYVAPCNLHFRLWEAALRFMMAAGAREVHSGPTAYRFKRDTGHELVPMRTYVRHRNRLLQHAIAMVTRALRGLPSVRLTGAREGL